MKESELRENDKILTILTSDQGVLTAYANGVRKMNSRLATGSSFLCYSDFCLFYHKNRYVVDDCTPKHLFYKIREDIEALSLASYFCELTQCFSPEGELSGDFLRLLLNALYLLENQKRPLKLVKAVYEWRGIAMAGYMPDLLGCLSCGKSEEQMAFSITQAGLLCVECSRKSQRPGLIALNNGLLPALRHVLYAESSKVFSFSLKEEGQRTRAGFHEGYAK